MLAALGQPAPQGEFEAMEALARHTGQPAPAALAGLRTLPERFQQTIRPEEIADVALGRK